MGRSRRLKAVVHDFAHFLSSRNFDLMGYWGMGVLADQIVSSGGVEKTYPLSPELLTSSKAGKYSHRLQRRFHDLAERQGVSRSQIKSADVGVSLRKVRGDEARYGGFGVGYDFQLLVTAVSTSEGKYQSERIGWVVPLGGEDWLAAPNRCWRYRREQW